jgi:hypothetical protein
MKGMTFLVTGLLAALWASCASKTGLKTPGDGAADVVPSAGGALVPIGSGGATNLGSGGVPGQAGSGVTGSGGRAVDTGGTGGIGGETVRGSVGGFGGVRVDAAISADAVDATVGPQLDGGTDALHDALIDLAASMCQTLLGGMCSELVNGCATCPSGSAPSSTRVDCPDQTWCCTPIPSATDECRRQGGVCMSGLESVCPPGWLDVWTSCSDMNSKCCMPKPEICNSVPRGCAEIGGVCTLSRWGRCPVGTEPYSLSSNQFGCEAYEDGWCCVDAPSSPCADSPGGGMCVPGDRCTGCFAAHPDPSMTCESGRVCCVDVCD